MSVLINNSSQSKIPDLVQFDHWINCVINDQNIDFEVSIQIVDKATSQELNKTYRGKNYPTNVLSFPMELPDIVEEKLIGDLAICAEIIENEAKLQSKLVEHQWAHMCIHGVLHLLGYDHVKDSDAQIMESLEIKLLAQLQIENPYD